MLFLRQPKDRLIIDSGSVGRCTKNLLHPLDFYCRAVKFFLNTMLTVAEKFQDDLHCF